jgi:very-short-patch-repair endonuclease
MILNEKILVKINNKNRNYYIKKGYCITSDVIDIKIIDLPTQSHQIILVKCDICNNIKQIQYDQYNKNTKNNKEEYCCSKKCSLNKCKRRLQEKYGVDNVFQLDEIKDKAKKTLNNIYGVDHPMHSEEIKKKLIKTNIERYGVKYAIMNEQVNIKKEETNIKKYNYKTPLLNNNIKIKIKKTLNNIYGVDHPMHSEEIKKKLIKTNIKRYGVDNPFKNLDIINKIQDQVHKTKFIKNIKLYKDKYNIHIVDYNDEIYTIKCDICNVEYNIHHNLLQNRIKTKTCLCTICNPINCSYSGKEKQLINFIESNYIFQIMINNRKIISPYELDIYLPDLNLAFEFNGIYWHNELNKEDDYHNNKTNMCLNKGIQLIHIWEDDWIYKQEIVKSMILNKLGKTANKIFARKCKIKEITNNRFIKEFLDDNHLQGFVGSKIKIGLFYDDDLVSLMTFGNLRKNMNSKSNSDDYEMLRFCNKLNTNVIGGASKLFNYFINNYKYNSIISYADRSYSNGNLYKQLGFKLQNITVPNYYYVIDDIRKYRFGFRKNILIKQGYDSNKTEHEIMLERKIYRIYNSGNYKFIYDLNNLKETTNGKICLV